MSEFYPIVPGKLLFRSRRLRQDSTHPERKLWSYLRAGRLCGLKFRRQNSIEGFIVDFYCHEHRLVVELDGESHNDRGKSDLKGESTLTAQRLRVLRFGNDDVLQDLEAVLRAILLACAIDPDGGAPLTEKP